MEYLVVRARKTGEVKTSGFTVTSEGRKQCFSREETFVNMMSLMDLIFMVQ
jgi:hypothetical protein